MFATTNPDRFQGICAVIDLEGFTPFCTQPDNPQKLPSFLNFVFNKVDDSFQAAGLSESWAHRKFLGDGALYVWRLKPNEEKALGTKIVLALHNLYRTYPTEILDEIDELNIRAAPKRIRVGIAQGEITELQADYGQEYAGFAINLAARLQHYCTPIGFLVSCSVPIDDSLLSEYSLVRVRTRKIRGMPGLEEDVRYVREDAAHLAKRERDKWFLEIQE